MREGERAWERGAVQGREREPGDEPSGGTHGEGCDDETGRGTQVLVAVDVVGV